MKLILAAAAAAIAMPAIAQDMPAGSTTSQTTTTTTTTPAPPPTIDPNAPPMAATGPYPMCTRTVVDHCMERSNTRGERLHTTPRPPGS